MAIPQPGSQAPDFTLPTGDGQDASLAEQRGKTVILYFYPADDTPGCTKEACAFRDLNTDIQQLGAVVWGVSADDIASHQAFTSKYSLNFPLLSDENREVIDAYGAWRERERPNGEKYMGIVRSTFAIGPDGTVAKVWESVPDAEAHTAEVFEWLQANQPA
jgi:peroxiredoxin Q/BCP